MIRSLILRFYNLKIEDIGVRILYFFNTIDTYFLVAGLISFLWYMLYLCGVRDCRFWPIAVLTAIVWLGFKTADFYPPFVLMGPLYLFFLFKDKLVTWPEMCLLLGINILVFVTVQFVFMSIPESIAAGDPSIGFRKLFYSVFTIAPTTVSFSMSVYFSTLYTLVLVTRPQPVPGGGIWFWVTFWMAALVTRLVKPRSFMSDNFRPNPGGKIAGRVLIINIDGCRLDRFYEAGMPFLTRLAESGSSFPKGLQTVYRALTNPAFASILTGVPPEVHGIRNNNLGQKISVKALPDLVGAKLYGSMHVRHFSRPEWNTKIVSLVKQGPDRADDVMFEWLREDLSNPDGTRLFIADISETDFLGHAYGSESERYLQALLGADRRIEELFQWMEKERMLDDTVVIICSDHGIVKIDHSYMLFRAERYVPFIMTGPGIKRGFRLEYEASIMDIAPTVYYLLGVPYPDTCRGRVFVEALESWQE